MKKTLHFLLYLALYFFSHATYSNKAAQQETWEEVKYDDGILVYVMHSDKSEIVKVKTQTVINASLKKIQAILDDVPHRSNWIPFLEHSKILHIFSDTEKLEHSHFFAPWPATDRDFLYRITRLQDDESNIIYHMKSETSPLMPVNDDLIRAELIESIYTLTALKKNKTHVQLIFFADPKGWLPTWIINIIQKALPYMMLQNLRELAQGKKEAEPDIYDLDDDIYE
jgi:hypothetical protein